MRGVSGSTRENTTPPFQNKTREENQTLEKIIKYQRRYPKTREENQKVEKETKKLKKIAQN